MSVWQKLFEEFEHLDIAEKRMQTETYCELVFNQTAQQAWSSCLARHLGPAYKAAGIEPSSQAVALADDHGGVRRNQTLFYKLFDTTAVAAMFWPWGNNDKITLKMWLIEKD